MSKELAAAFDKHIGETEKHILTLEQVSWLPDEKPAAKKCDAIASLLEEASGIIEDTDKGTMISDCGLIPGAQKVAHYGTATYGGLKTLAATMGRDDVAELLPQTLDNENATDEALTARAESLVNARAVAE